MTGPRQTILLSADDLIWLLNGGTVVVRESGIEIQVVPQFGRTRSWSGFAIGSRRGRAGAKGLYRVRRGRCRGRDGRAKNSENNSGFALALYGDMPYIERAG